MSGRWTAGGEAERLLFVGEEGTILAAGASFLFDVDCAIGRKGDFAKEEGDRAGDEGGFTREVGARVGEVGAGCRREGELGRRTGLREGLADLPALLECAGLSGDVSSSSRTASRIDFPVVSCDVD